MGYRVTLMDNKIIARKNTHLKGPFFLPYVFRLSKILQHPGDDIIDLPDDTYQLTIPGADEDRGTTGDLDISDNLTIIGAGPGDTVIDACGLGDRVMLIMEAEETGTISGLQSFFACSSGVRLLYCVYGIIILIFTGFVFCAPVL